MAKVTRLTVKNLGTLFGVTAMTVHNWKKGSATKPALPDPATPAAVKRWAQKHSVPMSCEPSALLGTSIGKPGPKPRLPASATSTRPLSDRAMQVLKKPRAA